MSHEVRTPMHGILGATELLRHADTSNRDAYIDTIEATGQHLLETLTKVLDYSRLEMGKPSINNTQNNLSAFIKKLEPFAGIWTHQARRSLTVNHHDDVPEFATFDAGSTRQILHNLFANAIAHGEGRITLSIRFETVHNLSDGILIFDVRDQGKRLRNQNLDQLFEPFYRERSDSHGTGLGLAICRHLAESLGGSIVALPYSDTGTTCFQLRLPLSKCLCASDQLDEPPRYSQCIGKKGNVMLVDDDPVSSRITADQLMSLGLQVNRFQSSVDCLHSLQQGLMQRNETDSSSPRWRYFVVDYQLPESNGAVLARRIRSIAGERSIRIIALTANTQLASEEDSKAFDLILTKPASAMDLLRALVNETPTRPDHTSGEAQDQHPFRGLPAESVYTIVQTFLTSWSEKLPGFLTDLESLTNPDAVRQQAHRLASSASSVGLVELTKDLRQ